MIHKSLLFLVLLVVSDFSNHKAVKIGRQAERTFSSGILLPKWQQGKSEFSELSINVKIFEIV